MTLHGNSCNSCHGSVHFCLDLYPFVCVFVCLGTLCHCTSQDTNFGIPALPYTGRKCGMSHTEPHSDQFYHFCACSVHCLYNSIQTYQGVNQDSQLRVGMMLQGSNWPCGPVAAPSRIRTPAAANSSVRCSRPADLSRVQSVQVDAASNQQHPLNTAAPAWHYSNGLASLAAAAAAACLLLQQPCAAEELSIAFPASGNPEIREAQKTMVESWGECGSWGELQLGCVARTQHTRAVLGSADKCFELAACQAHAWPTIICSLQHWLGSVLGWRGPKLECVGLTAAAWPMPFLVCCNTRLLSCWQQHPQLTVIVFPFLPPPLAQLMWTTFLWMRLVGTRSGRSRCRCVPAQHQQAAAHMYWCCASAWATAPAASPFCLPQTALWLVQRTAGCYTLAAAWWTRTSPASCGPTTQRCCLCFPELCLPGLQKSLAASFKVRDAGEVTQITQDLLAQLGDPYTRLLQDDERAALAAEEEGKVRALQHW